jgi:predicted enzyme related to lactoylglutathione lyase
MKGARGDQASGNDTGRHISLEGHWTGALCSTYIRKTTIKQNPFGSTFHEETQMSNPVGWFEIYVDDMARARQFYEAVLGVALQPLEGAGPDMLAFPSNMEHYGVGGALVHMDGFKAGGNSTLVYFSCKDCAVEEGRVAAAGGRIQKPKMSIGQYGHISLVMDTEGNMLGLHSM